MSFYPKDTFISTPKFWEQLIILTRAAGSPFDPVTAHYQDTNGPESAFLRTGGSAEARSPGKGGGAAEPPLPLTAQGRRMLFSG